MMGGQKQNQEGVRHVMQSCVVEAPQDTYYSGSPLLEGSWGLIREAVYSQQSIEVWL